jgi:5-methyltetrahydropteroyltriglutamate--homocysteine methyltransferase
MFGCIDPGDTPAPTVDSVMHRINAVLDHLKPEQVWLAPDCGLMTISRALAHEKLQVMVEAGRRLRARL